MDLKNLMIWYHYNEDGDIERIARLTACPPSLDLDKYFFEKYMEPPFAGGGIEEIKKEWIKVPYNLGGSEGVAFVMYAYGKRFAAVLPYYVTIEV